MIPLCVPLHRRRSMTSLGLKRTKPRRQKGVPMSRRDVRFRLKTPFATLDEPRTLEG